MVKSTDEILFVGFFMEYAVIYLLLDLGRMEE